MAPPPASAARNDKGKARAGKNADLSSSTRKEQRIAQRRQARTIPTQPQASTSSSTSSTLAPQLDVEPYLLSRRFEIAALRKAIKTSRSSSATRAWQLLPRHARRRAASHNVLRLPSRLRAKGLAELRSSTTLAKARSQIRKRLPNHPMAKAEARKLELRGRAARPEARWLETHLWLAKRFRMSREEFDGDRWGYVLPEEPYMKGEKTDWRATNGGCAIWDASWEQWVRVGVKLPKSAKGKEREMDVDGDFGAARGTLQQEEAVQLLEKLTMVARLVAGGSASGEALRLSASTSRITAFSATLHGGIENTNSDRALCPAKLYLVLPTRSEPVARSNDTTPTAGPSSSSSTAPAQPANPPQAAQARRLRRLLRLLPPPPQQSEINPDAELLVRTHPAAVDTLHRALQAAVIRVAKEATEKEEERAHFVVQRLEGPPADIVVGDDAAQRSPSRKGATSASSGLDADPCSSSAKLAQTHLSSHLKHRLSLLRQSELRNRAFCTFELYGPKSGEVLGRVLQLSAKGTNEETRRRWEEMTAKPTGDGKRKVDDTEAVRPKDSSGEGIACLSVRVHDPRLGLRRGPTTRAPGRKGGAQKGKQGQSKQGPAALSPSAAKEASSNQAAPATSAGKRKLTDSDLSADAEGPPSKAARTLEGEQNVPHTTAKTEDRFVPTTRHPHLLTNGYPYPSQTQGDLDSRRSALLASGLAATSKKRGRARTTNSLLEPTSKDDVIPVVIVPRADGVQGFTLLVPQGWGRPFWHALLGSKAIPGTGSGEVRPLGLGGWRALQRETGRASFPGEWPYAPAVASKGRGKEKRQGGQATAWQRSVSFAAAKREEEWARRPKAKRINYEKLGVSWPFGGVEMWMSCARTGEGVLREELLKLGQSSGKAKPDERITTERADKDAGHGLHLHGSTLLLRAQIFWLRQLLATTTVVPPSAHQLLLGRARSLLLHSCSSSTSAASSSKPTKRDTSHALVLVNLETLPGTGGALSEGDELHLLPYAGAMQGSNGKAMRGKRQPIGALTSGRFSLTRGRSTGMALCSASAWVWAVASSHSSAGQTSRATPFATEVGKGEGEGDETDVPAEKKRLKKMRGLIGLAEQGLNSIWQDTVDSEGSNGVEQWESARLIVRSISGGTEREVVARLVRV
ncbi:POP1-domain-containing protein [Jaminaea rosea]|uniref:POP1-domain-containing protein n=1 Tax=Jaminaea rosea TaxID=1569628 RepID=A0A316ULD6_9BASI|nr:POP1-domain-containing protein [Jaminaea rosea]PWN24733.1 POP1-domain-containing protein [Jaminaea rosea]